MLKLDTILLQVPFKIQQGLLFLVSFLRYSSSTVYVLSLNGYLANLESDMQSCKAKKCFTEGFKSMCGIDINGLTIE